MDAQTVIAVLMAALGFVLGLYTTFVVRRVERGEQTRDKDERRNQERTKELHDRINPMATQIAALETLTGALATAEQLAALESRVNALNKAVNERK